MDYNTVVSSFSDAPKAITLQAQVESALNHKPQEGFESRWLESNNFSAKSGQFCPYPDEEGALSKVLIGLSSAEDSDAFAKLALTLPKAVYDLPEALDDGAKKAAAIAWGLAQYQFTAYKVSQKNWPQLQLPSELKQDVLATVEAIYLVRDLINTPTQDMGPAELSQAMAALAAQHQAEFSEVVGVDLLTENFPAIHAVGRASDSEPRLLEMNWGDDTHPKLTLVGKGVCFDSGGLDIKPSSGMRFMKKDMGGAAHVLGLAKLIMQLNLNVRLQVLIPAVENAIAGNAYRPGDILETRKGLSVEVGNTDAEGRLVLADALAYGAEQTPDLMISMATLTGAARVAVGPDLAPYFTDDTGIVTALEKAAEKVADPVWRLPFHTPYEAMIEPGIADLDNAPRGGFAGSITAALFLRRFTGAARYAHFDIYGWNPAAAPARPKGGVGMGARALLAALPEVLDL